MENVEQSALLFEHLDGLAKFCCLRHDQTFMPQKPLPLIISLKRWREENAFSQSEAVRVLNVTGIAVTLDSLQNWEVRRWRPRANVALALADFLRAESKNPTMQMLDAAIWREIGSDEPNRQKLSSKLFPASWLVGCSPVPKLPRWKH